MPECQAFGCVNERGKVKNKSFFQIPNAEKNPEKRELAIRWLHNIGTGHNVNRFTFGKHKVVCEDHFESWCFDTEQKRQSDRLGYVLRQKTLVDHAVPTIFIHRKPHVDKDREARAKKRDAKKHRVSNPVTKLKQISVLQGTFNAYEAHESSKRALPPATITGKTITVSSASDVHTDIESHSVWEQSPNINNTKAVMVSTAVQTDPPVPPVESPIYCTSCLNPVGSVNVIQAMHSYCKKPGQKLVDVTEDGDINPLPKQPVHSTPIKAGTSINCSFHDNSFEDSIDMDDSVSSNDMETSEYLPSDELSSDEHEDEPAKSVGDSVVEDKKYLVFASTLEQLLYKIPCGVCGSAVDEIQKDTVGSMIRAKLYCISGHMFYSWDSQPLIGKMPAGNLLMSASILLSGENFSHIQEFSEVLNLQFFSPTVFYDIQRNLLTPIIDRHWQNHKRAVMEELKSNVVQLAGDGRCDSPGFSAKYCTYTLMDVATDKIVDFELIQVNQTSSSNAMEKLGFETVLDRVLDESLCISDISTDRHISIKKLMRTKYKAKGIDHQFDPYHVANWIRKKLSEKVKLKRYKELSPWIKSILNHLWWSASSCNGDPELLLEKWESILHHINNRHSWNGKFISGCQHDPLTPEQERNKKWIKKGSPAFLALKDIVCHKSLHADLGKLCKFIHTGKLEVYHSLINKYCPKRLEFDYAQMMARTQLAALDHNFNVGRQQAVIMVPHTGSDEAGKLRYRTNWSKATKQWVARPILEPKRYTYRRDVLLDVVDSKLSQAVHKVSYSVPGSVSTSQITQPRPMKAELVAKHKSRF